MTKMFLAAVVAIFFAAIPAVADTPLGNTVVSIPWGDIVSYILPAIGTLFLGGILWIAQTFAPPVYALLRTAQVEQLMERAKDFGINSVAGAVKGKTLDFNVGNDVLREMLVYILTHKPQWLEDFAGTPEELAQKAFARLDLDGSTSKPDFAEVAVEAQVRAFGSDLR